MIPLRSRTIEPLEESFFGGPTELGVDVFVATRSTRYDFRSIGASSRNGTSFIFLRLGSPVTLMFAVGRSSAHDRWPASCP